ncbi:hypothetical protein CAPTEDRAFT_218803 [Capitella teleta]|uniref:Gamma-glutamylcyclotransferase family protein n=1 Tax=Capitella teleta TaxID=283909 RepID=R7TXB0_CAPTE|nr:hypothetical protein CAPTEDRAFT_218803 [Capitella teleta]|eukprot:ELT98237.1 hypothetical protein CAPTEDRAFT_218803 [Capitella teleta]
MAMHQVFVYGTLKKGQPNHYLMNDPSRGVARFISEGLTVQRFPLVIASRNHIPCVLNEEGSGNVELQPSSEIVTVHGYIIHDFLPELLHLPFHSKYDAFGDHGLDYVLPKDSVVNNSSFAEIKMNFNKELL